MDWTLLFLPSAFSLWAILFLLPNANHFLRTRDEFTVKYQGSVPVPLV